MECARNVLKLRGANSAEIDPGSAHIIISPVSCALPQNSSSGPRLSGPIPGIRLKAGSLLHAIYGCDEVVEEFFCNFEVNPEYEPQFASVGLDVVARGSGGEARAVELAGRRFFVATLFQPQLSSTAQRPHPLLTAFLRAAREFVGERQTGTRAARA